MSQQIDWAVQMERKQEQEYVQELVGKIADLVNGNSTKKVSDGHCCIKPA